MRPATSSIALEVCCCRPLPASVRSLADFTEFSLCLALLVFSKIQHRKRLRMVHAVCIRHGLAAAAAVRAAYMRDTVVCTWLLAWRESAAVRTHGCIVQELRPHVSTLQV